MKYLFLFSTCITLLLASCQKEYMPEGVGNNGGGTGGGGTPSSVCKDCLYFPTCDGSIFTFKDSRTGTTAITTSDTLHYVKDSIINAVVFRKLFYSSNSQQFYFLNCASGVVKNFSYNISQGGTTISKLEIIVLKYLADAGTQWTDTVTVQGQQLLNKNTLTQKNISYTVGGKTYPDVMHVTILTGQNIPIAGFTALITTENYFAKGVGLIESTSVNNLSGDIVLKRSLQAYLIP